ncbi:MAG: hypothetical protein ACD_73C00814G0007 [uncultured bacterium]|nr:MAG: hypothetical protein ACD_73C00814G0007 [uncultured bacterium]
MTNSILSTEDLKGLINKGKSAAKVAHYWTQDTQSLDLFKKSQKDDDKIQKFKQFQEGIVSSFQEVFSNSIDHIIETEWSLTNVEIFDGAKIAEKVDLEKFFCHLWKNHDETLIGYYFLDKSVFFKIYDLQFGGNRIHIQKGGLRPLEETALGRMINPINDFYSTKLGSFGVSKTSLKEIIYDSAKIFEEVSKSRLVQINFDIKNAEASLGSFQIIIGSEILRYFSAADEAGVTENQSHDHTLQNTVKQCIRDVAVKIGVELGLATTSLKDILNVKVGDEWILSIPEAGHLIEVERIPFGIASIGEANGCRAIQIKELITQGE